MAEGSLYDRELAALAVKQARGDLIEAIFLHARLPHDAAALRRQPPVDTGAMRIERRVSATFKDLPGGQLLGPTFDYTHRLIDPGMAGDDAGAGRRSAGSVAEAPAARDGHPRRRRA